jgi:hypothetical protein
MSRSPELKLAGHMTAGMTGYYNKRIIDASLSGLTGADTAGKNLYPGRSNRKLRLIRQEGPQLT